MKRVELYQKVRRVVMIDGMNRPGAASYLGINRNTICKMLVFPEPPEHGRCGGTYTRKLAGFTEIIDQIMTDDRTVHAKQRHTGVRIFGSERLTGALLDRLTHHVHILEMNGDSFRLASSRKRQKDTEQRDTAT